MTSITLERSSQEADNTPLLTLIRHPETVANLAHALQGATDSPWTVQGQHQAERLAEHVGRAVRQKDLILEAIQWNVTGDVVRAKGSHVSPLLRPGRSPTHILASPLGRTRLLADRIREATLTGDGQHAPEIELREGLQERNFGSREGQIYSKGSAKTQSAKPIVDPAIVATMRAESSDAFQSRVSTEADTILATLQQYSNSNEPPHIVVVTHGLWIRSFLSLVMGKVHLPFTNNTGIFTLGLLDTATRNAANRPAGQDRYGLICQNDISHLAGLKRQRGGIGSSASDNRQQTLGQLWQVRKRPKEDRLAEDPGSNAES